MGRKISRIMVLFSFLIMMTATIPFGYAYEWSPDMTLTWNSEMDINPSIAQTSDGKIWAVWHSYRTGNADIFYKVYDSYQVHPWSSEKNLTANPNVDKSPTIMQAEDGKIWVVWSSNRTGNYEIYYKTSSDNGANWSPDHDFIANPKDDECPSIMQTANGTIWLAWSANRTGNYEIYYKTSSDNGATWSPNMFLNYSLSDDQDPSITQAADGKIWFVWERYVFGKDSFNIWYKTYNATSNQWSATTAVTQDSGSILNVHPSVMPAKDGKIWIAWDSDKVGLQADIYYRVYYPDGRTFVPITRLTYNQGDDIIPSIMQAADGAIWIAWASWRTGDPPNCDIYYMTMVAGWNGWTPIGASPWLNASDYPKNYIYTKITGDRIGNFTFGNVPKGTTWSTVTLRIKTWKSGDAGGSDQLKIYLSDGTSWNAYTVTPTNTTAPGGYVDTDVTNFLNTEAKINATKMALEKLTTGSEDTIYVDHACLFFSGLEFNENVDGRITELYHDVAMFSVIPTEVTVNAGQTVSIEVVAQNHGNNFENFIVILYADLTPINQSTIGLSPGQLYPKIFTWTASSTGTYKIWAKASVVYGEIYTVDNNFPAILGDVNDDRTVNASDLFVFSQAYGSKPTDSNWNPNCNFDGFNGDNKVDIFDLFDLSKNYGKS